MIAGLVLAFSTALFGTVLVCLIDSILAPKSEACRKHERRTHALQRVAHALDAEKIECATLRSLNGQRNCVK